MTADLPIPNIGQARVDGVMIEPDEIQATVSHPAPAGSTDSAHPIREIHERG